MGTAADLADPQHIESLNAAQLIHEEVCDQSRIAERHGPYGAARVVVVQRVTVPRDEFQHTKNLGQGS